MSELEEIAAIRARANAATKGPWRWVGNMKFNEIYLATEKQGRRYVMQFWRWGMAKAQPVFQSDNLMRPLKELVERGEIETNDYRAREILNVTHADMAFIANARQDIDTLLAHLDALAADRGRTDAENVVLELAVKWEVRNSIRSGMVLSKAIRTLIAARTAGEGAA